MRTVLRVVYKNEELSQTILLGFQNLLLAIQTNNLLAVHLFYPLLLQEIVTRLQSGILRHGTDHDEENRSRPMTERLLHKYTFIHREARSNAANHTGRKHRTNVTSLTCATTQRPFAYSTTPGGSGFLTQTACRHLLNTTPPALSSSPAGDVARPVPSSFMPTSPPPPPPAPGQQQQQQQRVTADIHESSSAESRLFLWPC